MKNKKTVVYINYSIILFCIVAIVLNLMQFYYFTQFVFILAFVSIILLIINNVILSDVKKCPEPKTKHIIEEKQQNLETEIKEEKEDGKLYLSLISGLDKSLSEKETFDFKFQKLSESIQLVAGLAYLLKNDKLFLESTYGLVFEEHKNEIDKGSGLTGQVALNGLPIEIDMKDQIDLEIISGLGKSKPNFLYILPVLKNKKVFGVVELATFNQLSKEKINFLIEAFEK